MCAMTATPAVDESELRTVLERHDLDRAAVAVVQLSFARPGSFIGAHDPDGRITPLIGFLPLPVRGADLLDAIAAIDENGPRLVANFRRAFPDLAGGLAAFAADVEPVRTDSLGLLLSACSLVLGLDDGDVSRALVRSPGGVKVDTVVIEEAGRFLVDGRRLVRSVMSYRLGDVPAHLLARSIFESLGDFAGDAVWRLLQEWRAEAVVCAGDLFERNTILRASARRALSRVGVPVHLPPAPAGAVAGARVIPVRVRQAPA
jgi:hypothetical protein